MIYNYVLATTLSNSLLILPYHNVFLYVNQYTDRDEDIQEIFAGLIIHLIIKRRLILGI